MNTFLLICAVAGGAFLLCQFAMILLGLGSDWHDGGGFDSHGGDVAGHSGDVGADADAGGPGHGGDFHADAAGHGQGGSDGHGAQGHDDSQAPAHTASQAAWHYDVSWLLRAISLRTLVAAITFFGLTGLAAQSAHASTGTTLVAAAAAGLAALYGVYWLMHTLYGLKAEGTARIERAVGRRASVYLHIPAANSGCGKVQVNLQNRTMEYLAVTDGEAIPTGATVTIVEIIDPGTVRVTAVCPSERSNHVDASTVSRS